MACNSAALRLLSWASPLAVLALVITSSGAGAGVDHLVSPTNSGIWARPYSQELQYGVIATEVSGALWLGDESELGVTFWQTIDSSIFNAGEADEQLNANVTATWNGAGLTASDALAGWNMKSENGRAIFRVIASQGLRLPPCATRKIGWLRFDQTTTLEITLSANK